MEQYSITLQYGDLDPILVHYGAVLYNPPVWRSISYTDALWSSTL